jgi:hypothetical protein
VFKWIYDNIYSGIDTRGLNKINQEFSYLKDKSIIEKKKKYDNFKSLLEHNKVIKKGSGNKLTIKQIEEITELYKSEYYRIKKKLEKGNWKDIERKKSTRPNNLRQSKLLNNNNNNNNNNIIKLTELMNLVKLMPSLSSIKLTELMNLVKLMPSLSSIKLTELIGLTELEIRVLEIRTNNPTYGKRKLCKIIKRDYFRHLHISDSSIGRILKHLHIKNLITLNSNKLKKKKKPNDTTKPRNFEGKHAQRWNYKKHHISNLKNVKYNNINIIDNINKISMEELIQE